MLGAGIGEQDPVAVETGMAGQEFRAGMSLVHPNCFVPVSV